VFLKQAIPDIRFAIVLTIPDAFPTSMRCRYLGSANALSGWFDQQITTRLRPSDFGVHMHEGFSSFPLRVDYFAREMPRRRFGKWLMNDFQM
jgi:hypothetical protein